MEWEDKFFREITVPGLGRGFFILTGGGGAISSLMFRGVSGFAREGGFLGVTLLANGL